MAHTRKMIKKFLALSALAIFGTAAAQRTYTVKAGDNPTSIARQHNISLNELIRLNPSAKDGKLQIGEVLVISQGKAGSAGTNVQKTSVKTTATGTIVLQPKQTLYGITKQYHISEEEVRKLNPNLQMKVGEEVVLPLENLKKYALPGQEVRSTTVSTTTTTVSAPESDTYTVQPKDNYYRITKQFGITQQQLFAMNPGLEAKGLQPGDVIVVKGDAKNLAQNSSPGQSGSAAKLPGDEFVTYTVRDGDTVFGILNRYQIDLDDLLTLNPDVTKGLKAGMVLRIKKAEAAYVKTSGDALSVVLMLPFGFDTKDAKMRGIATDFLSGAKLAIERNARQGMKLDIRVIDAGNEANFKNALSQLNQNNTDLIIGPFFKSNVKEVLDFVGPKKIPVVAPFANSEDLYGYSNLIIVETSDEVYAQRIIREVKDAYNGQKIFIVADKDRKYADFIKSDLEKLLKNPQVEIVNSPNEIQPEKNMMTGQNAPVIAVLANSSDSVGNAFADKVISLTKETSGVKAFSMYYSPVFEKKVDALSQANFVYLMDRKISGDSSFEKEVLADYRAKYCKAPPKYAVIGFDVVNDMLSRENSRGEIFRQMNKPQTQLATKFEFVRAKNNGAYINTGYRVVRLVP